MKTTTTSRQTLQTMFSSVAALVSLSVIATAQTPILKYSFNESGTDALSGGSAAVTLPMTQWDGVTWNSGDNHGAAGSGVSGQPADKAYHDPSVVLDPAQTAGTSNSHYFGGFAGGFNVVEAQTLPALTVQGWFKPPAGKMVGEVDGSYGALIGNLGSSTNDGGWVVRTQTSATAGTLEFRYGEDEFTANHSTIASTAGVYSETDQWVFFAVTLDATTGNVEFFKGTSALAVESAGTGSQGPLTNGAITLSNRSFYIGNSASEGAQWSQGRAFNGDLDNLRVFDSVLTTSELDQIRQADLLPPSLQGDYNGDGKVDAADYVMWRKNPAGFGGDPTGYDTWRANFGQAGGSSAALSTGVVPEPSTLMLGGLLVTLVIAGRRRK